MCAENVRKARFYGYVHSQIQKLQHRQKHWERKEKLANKAQKKEANF